MNSPSIEIVLTKIANKNSKKFILTKLPATCNEFKKDFTFKVNISRLSEQISCY